MNEWNENRCEQIYQLSARGISGYELEKEMGVDLDTILAWYFYRTPFRQAAIRGDIEYINSRRKKQNDNTPKNESGI